MTIIGTLKARVLKPALKEDNNAMNIRPLQDRLVVKRMEEETTSAGGIYIPDSATEKQSRGEILAVGPGKKNDNGELISMDVKVGDAVLFSDYAGKNFKDESGEELLIMREEDILGVFEA